MTVNFGTHTINYPKLELVSGIILVTGASGTGKTTLLRVLHGILKADGPIPNVEGSSSIMSQTPTWIPYLRMHEQLKVAGAQGVDFTSLGLDQLVRRFPHELSIGQLQRFSLLAALHVDSELLLLDEPTSALDDDWADKAIELIENWSIDNSLGTVIVVTHDERLKKAFSAAKRFEL